MTREEYIEITIRKSGEFMGLYSMIEFACSLKTVEYFMGKEGSEKKGELMTHIHHKFNLENKLDIIAKEADAIMLKHLKTIRDYQKIRNIFAHSTPHIPKGLDKIEDPNRLNELFYNCLRKYDKNWTRENAYYKETFITRELDEKIQELYDVIQGLK